jgi:hypothetical protein
LLIEGSAREIGTLLVLLGVIRIWARVLATEGVRRRSSRPSSNQRLGEGSFAGAALPRSSVKWMKEHTPNLPAVFNGLRKAGLPEE